VEEAFEEDQGSCRAVEPMMMVSIVTIWATATFR
jgi:hypothetical protein